MTSSDIYTKLYRLKNDTGITPTLEYLNLDNIKKIISNDIFNKIIVGNKNSKISEYIEKLNNAEWVKQGYTAYIEKDNNICPFCQKETITNEFINSLKGNLNTEEYKFNSENNHYLKYVDKDMDDDGNVLETPIYFLNDDDINDITTRLDKLDVERKTNIVLITEVEKQFVDIIEGKIKPEAAAKKIINNVEVYLNE